MEISLLSKTSKKIMHLKKLKQEKLPTALKEKVNNISMKLGAKIFQNHFRKEEFVIAMHVHILYKGPPDTNAELNLLFEFDYKHK
jgi:citrate lyase alpha subunit